jgi:hypothetical protein
MLDYHNKYCNKKTQYIAECGAPDFVLNDSLAATWEHSPANFLTDFIELKTTLAEALQLIVSMTKKSITIYLFQFLLYLADNKRPHVINSNAVNLSKTLR